VIDVLLISGSVGKLASPLGNEAEGSYKLPFVWATRECNLNFDLHLQAVRRELHGFYQ
jgi:hypothetical protein